MRNAGPVRRSLLPVLVAALALPACSVEEADDEALVTPSPSAVTSASPSPSPSPAPVDETASGSASPAPPSSSGPAPAGVPTTVDPDVFSGYPAVRQGVEAWDLLGCRAGRPQGDVTDMGGAEQPFRDDLGEVRRQVTVLGSVDAAVAEARRLGEVAGACPDEALPDGVSSETEPLDVGADGVLLQRASVDSRRAAGVFRRGTAVVVVGADGNFQAGSGLEQVVREGARDLFAQLCPYERGDAC